METFNLKSLKIDEREAGPRGSRLMTSTDRIPVGEAEAVQGYTTWEIEGQANRYALLEEAFEREVVDITATSDSGHIFSGKGFVRTLNGSRFRIRGTGGLRSRSKS